MYTISNGWFKKNTLYAVDADSQKLLVIVYALPERPALQLFDVPRGPEESAVQNGGLF